MWPENEFYNIFNYYQNSGCISLLPARKHFRGKQVGLFLAVPFSRNEISPSPLALSVVSAMHLSVPSTPLSHWANHFRSNETAISIRHECCCQPWLAAGKQSPLCRLELGWKRWALWVSRKQWGFKSRTPNPVSLWFGTHLSASTRAGCLHVWVRQNISSTWGCSSRNMSGHQPDHYTGVCTSG